MYVRRETEEVFDALMLKTPDLKGLRNAVRCLISHRGALVGYFFNPTTGGQYLQVLSPSQNPAPP